MHRGAVLGFLGFQGGVALGRLAAVLGCKLAARQAAAWLAASKKKHICFIILLFM